MHDELLALHPSAAARTVGIVEHRNNIGDVMPDMHPRLVEALKDMDEPMKRAEKELEFAQRYNILPMCPLFPLCTIFRQCILTFLASS